MSEPLRIQDWCSVCSQRAEQTRCRICRWLLSCSGCAVDRPSFDGMCGPCNEVAKRAEED